MYEKEGEMVERWSSNEVGEEGVVDMDRKLYNRQQSKAIVSTVNRSSDYITMTDRL